MDGRILADDAVIAFVAKVFAAPSLDVGDTIEDSGPQILVARDHNVEIVFVKELHQSPLGRRQVRAYTSAQLAVMLCRPDGCFKFIESGLNFL